MMKEKNGKVCRNIQEQVQKNMEDISKLKRRTPIDSFVQHLSTDEKNVLNVEQNVDGEYKPYSIYLGTNLLLNPDGQGNFTLSASGEISGTVNFVDILGEPTDNLKLKPYLDKIDRVPSLDQKNDWNGIQTFNGTYTDFNGDGGISLWMSGRDSSKPWMITRFVSRYITFHKEEEDAGTVTLRFPYHLEEGAYTLMVEEEHNFAKLLGKPEDNKALSDVLDNARKQIESLDTNKQDKATLDKDVGALGYIKNVPLDNLVTVDGDQTISGIKTFKYARFNETIDGTVHQATIHGNRIQHRFTVGTAFPSYEFLFPDRSGTLALKEDITNPNFKDIVGEPGDNEKLNNVLTNKADKKQLDLYQTKTDVNLQTASKEIVGAINEVNSKATGQVIAYTINSTTAGNEPFNTTSYLITATSFVDVNGFTHKTSELKATDLIIVENEGIPSRVYTGNNTFMRQATTPELQNYYTIDQTNGLLAAKVDYDTLSKDVEGAGFRLASVQDEIDANKQDKLIAGEGITIIGNTISSTAGGVTDYGDLDNKPTIDGVELRKGSTASELGLLTTKDKDDLISRISNKQDIIPDLDTIRQDSLLGATAVQPEQLDPINEHLDSHDKSISQAEVDIGNLQNQVGTISETVNGHTTELGNLTTDVKNVKEVQDAHGLRIYEVEQNKQDKIETSLTMVFTLEDGSEETHELYSKE